MKTLGKDEKRKRARIELACEGCRQRKTRCDGIKPKCGICLKRNIDCVYGKRYTRAQVSTDYVKSLEKRLGMLPSSSQELEDLKLKSTNQDDKQADTIGCEGSHSSTNDSVVSSQSFIYQLDPDNEGEGGSIHLNEAYQEKSDSRDEDGSTDAMGAATNYFSRNAETSFYGSSAAMSFMKELHESLDENRLTNGIMEESFKYKMTRTTPQKGNIKNLSSITVPPRSIADYYVQNYFNYAYPLYPFVHKPTFMIYYETIWSAVDVESLEMDELFYSIVNIIFAFGHLLTSEGEIIESNYNGNVYFERSQELLHFHLMETGSVLLVQALLLTGQFLQATTLLTECWNTVGLAIRIAQGLGLHLGQNGISQKSYIEEEMQKRLWHGCLLMDRMVAMTFGRPLMVTGGQTRDLPNCINDEYITDENIGDTLLTDKPSILGFFLETVKLYDILAEILKSFYSNDGPCHEEVIVSIFKLEEKLHNFQENIPTYIRFGQELKEIPYERQSIVLRIRLLHVRIMLYRPVLFLKNKLKNNYGVLHSELSLSSQKTISILCVETAIELIDLISKYRHAGLSYLPAVWYTVFYLYTAAAVLLAAKLQPNVGDHLDSKKFELTWKHGLELFASYQSQSDSAARCLKVLEKMDDKICTIRKNPPRFLENDNIESIIPSNVPTDMLYSVMFDTSGPFGGPFFHNDTFN